MLLLSIKDPLLINEFIQLITKEINNKDNNIFTSIVEQYSVNKEGIVEEIKESDIEVELVSTTEALKAIEIVKLQETQ